MNFEINLQTVKTEGETAALGEPVLRPLSLSSSSDLSHLLIVVVPEV